MPEIKIDDFTRNIALMGKSKAISLVNSFIKRIAKSDLPVLLKGEPGVGHSLVAREIHSLSPRSNAPFIEANLAAIPPHLVGSQLFGHERGAYTGAVQRQIGSLETARGGTLYLGEIESTPEDIQGMLTRVFDNPTIVRFGGSEHIPLDLRIIGGSGPNVESVSSLRQNLVSRLSGFVIEIPPLRNRPEDIRLLGEYLLKRESESASLSDATWTRLEEYSFPENISELARIIKRAITLSDGKLITEEHLMLPKATKVQGENIVDHLQNQLNETRKELELLKSNSISADPIWEGCWFPVEDNYCFVLMPFADVKDLQKVYTNHVKPTLENRCHLCCERADDIHDISGVMQSVWEGINRARIIIADLTERNPNVFYELGIAHTLGKPVIMITQSMNDVPFDLRHLRCIVYEYKPYSINRFEDALEKTIQRLLASTTYK